MKKRKQNKFSHFGSWLRNLNPPLFSLVLIGITATINIVVTAPVELGWVNDIEFKSAPLNMDWPLWGIAIVAIIFAPIYETALFQTLPFLILRRFAIFRRNRWAIVLIAALIFGSLHCYSVMYMIATAIIGALMMYGYIVKWRRHAYLNLVLFHALWNGLAVAFKAFGIE